MKYVWIILVVTMFCLYGVAQERWEGAGVDNNWSTAENWADDSPPPNPYTGTVYFGNDGFGTNVMDADWKVRYLVYTNIALDGMHTLDLGGDTLTIEGYLQAWQYNSSLPRTNSNTRVAITNGTIQLGTATHDADLRVTYWPSTTAFNYITTNNSAVISVALLATNWGNLYVAYHSSSYYSGTIMEGALDLSRSVIVSEGVSNRIKCANFVVGGATSATSCRGNLRLPAAITEIETGDFVVGGAGPGNGWGCLDLGSESQLQRIIARGKFWYGAGSDAVISNWPGDVDLLIGTSTAPASFRVGSGSSAVANIGAALTISNAVLSGYLSDFLVGTALSYNYGKAITGHVDLACSAIHTGGESNALHCTQLRIGDQTVGMANKSSKGKGSLYLPPSLKKICAGLFHLGGQNGGFGLLDLGENAQLEEFTVTNDFYYGYCGGRAILRGMPTNGVAFSLGTPAAPSFLSIGSTPTRTYVYDGEADLVLVNADFKAHLQSVEIGVSHYNGQYDYSAVGMLDLSQSTIEAFEVADSIEIGHGHNSPAYQRFKCARGRVYFPNGTVNIATNLLMGDTIAPSVALLDLSGTLVTVGASVELWPTATINARVQGVTSGLELLSSAADTLSVSNGAVINVIFEHDPINTTQRRYSGLAVAGDRITLFKELHADGSLVWDTQALAPHLAKKIDIRYDAMKDITYVGFDPRTHGTILLVR